MAKLAQAVDLAATIPVAGAEVAGAVAGGVALSPAEVMHQLSESWIKGSTVTERAELMRALLRQGQSSNALLAALEGEAGEKVLSVSANRIPKNILAAAGSSRKQAQFTNTVRMIKQFRGQGASTADVNKVFGLAMTAAKQAGIPAAKLDALRRMGAERVVRHGAANIVRVHDIATKESWARRALRWATRGDARFEGKKSLIGAPTDSLAVEVRTQLDEMAGLTKQKLADKIDEAKGVFGKTRVAVKGGAEAIGGKLSPQGLTAAEGGILGELKAVGAKGLSKGARFARGLGGGGTILAAGVLGFEAYDALVGKSKRARAALEASRSGGTASVSSELMYDILDKRADLQARRAKLAQNPELMQSIVGALGGQQKSPLTKSEAGFGIDLGPQGASPDQMNKLLDQLLGQMRGG